MAMSAIYERQSENMEDYTRQFRPIEGQVGAVFLHKIFSYRKNFIWTPERSPALPWPWTTR